MHKKLIISGGLLAAFVSLAALPSRAATVAENVAGRILLQVEAKGEAWYVHPTTKTRHSLGRPQQAFEVMRAQGIGITNADLKKIRVGVSVGLTGTDTDSDGLSDAFEDAYGTDKSKADTDSDSFLDGNEVKNGYNAAGPGRQVLDTSFAARQKGRIFLQVESKGEAWYVNPADGLRYYLGRPDDAFSAMRALGLGITNADLGAVQDSTTTTTSGTKTEPPSREEELTPEEKARLADIMESYPAYFAALKDCTPFEDEREAIFALIPDMVSHVAILGMEDGKCVVRERLTSEGSDLMTQVCRIPEDQLPGAVEQGEVVFNAIVSDKSVGFSSVYDTATGKLVNTTKIDGQEVEFEYDYSPEEACEVESSETE